MKILFDYFSAILLIPFIIIPFMFFWLLTVIINGGNGFFLHERIGKNQKTFKICKLKSFNRKGEINKFGYFIRKYKIDEIPQLINVLKGEMSFVGPRPDVESFSKLLKEEEMIIFKLKPGITGLASLKYYNEEELLSKQEDPNNYNQEVIFKDKIKLNLEYYHCHNLVLDIKIILKTIKILIFKT